MKESFFDFVQKNYDFGETSEFREKLFNEYPEEVERAIAEEDPPQRDISKGLRRREAIETLEAIKVGEIDRLAAEAYKYNIVLYFVDCEKYENANSAETEHSL